MSKLTPSSQILKRYLANDCSDDERKMVDDWYASMHHHSDEVFSEDDQKALFSRIEDQIVVEENHLVIHHRTKSRWWKYAGGIAAALLLSLGIHFYNLPQKTHDSIAEMQVQIKNDLNKILRYELPDKSIIWLQPGSSIEHPRSFEASANRQIKFNGEAFFDITKNPKQPFVIESGKMKTVVLGTSFNIKAHQNDAEYQVSVVTGKVSVSAMTEGKEAETILLQPQQRAVFQTTTNDLTFHTIENKKSNIEHWQPVSLTFDDAPLGDIVTRLQKTFGTKISLANPAMANCVLKVDFNQQNLPEILEMLNTLLGSTYELREDNITLLGDGCNDH